MILSPTVFKSKNDSKGSFELDEFSMTISLPITISNNPERNIGCIEVKIVEHKDKNINKNKPFHNGRAYFFIGNYFV